MHPDDQAAGRGPSDAQVQVDAVRDGGPAEQTV